MRLRDSGSGMHLIHPTERKRRDAGRFKLDFELDAEDSGREAIHDGTESGIKIRALGTPLARREQALSERRARRAEDDAYPAALVRHCGPRHERRTKGRTSAAEPASSIGRKLRAPLDELFDTDRNTFEHDA